ncbi:MAG: AAA family ATPase [Deltaproteobacteria bacterium]|nr:AAA family ATPase [Deltaproteobacteria bacterium]
MSHTIEGFRELEEVHRGASSLVLRGIRVGDGRRVIVKTTSHRRPSRAEIASLVREMRLARKASSSRSVEMLEQRDVEGVPILVMADAGGTPLDRVLRESTLDLETKLEIALATTLAIEAVHARGVVHKDVNPSNILWSSETRTARLIDFGIATELERERPSGLDVHRLEGTLHYLAPEQTGRTNRRVDRRSDLYALGVTLYELFTGRRPFASSDALELVHAHLARRPIPPHDHDEAIPETVSEIVLRLLAKAAEDRYQSATGLAVDLEECLRLWRATRSIGPFALARADRPPRLEISERLYGREREARAIEEALDRAASGTRELLLVGGVAGIGKTSLVHATLGAVTAHRAHFLEGKFDPLRLGVAYEPLAAAVGRFLQSILAESPSVVSDVKERLSRTLVDHAGVLFDLLPELAAFVTRPTTPPPEAPVAEAENRFHLAFRALVGALVDAPRPLVLFLDDLQWADLSTLRLLEGLVTDESLAHLVVIGAYRANEIDAAHPLSLTRERVARGGLELVSIELVAPGEAALRRMLSDTFARDDEALAELSSRCIQRTGGNPFFLGRLLADLVDRDLVSWDGEQRRWAWDASALAELEPRRLDGSDTVVALLVDRIGALPEDTRLALAHAACVGSTFDLRALARLSSTSPARVQSALDAAVTSGLVSPRGKGWRLEDGDTTEDTPDEAFLYAFEHDRIQAAAYETLAPDARDRVHLALGRALLEDGDDRGFDAIRHLNLACDLLDPHARHELAKRNRDAGLRARRGSAFAAASSFFEAGLRALRSGAAGDAFEVDAGLAFELSVASAECAYLIAARPLTQRRLEDAYAHAPSPLARVEVQRVDIGAHIAAQDLHGAIRLAREALVPLGVTLPAEATDADVGAAVGRAMTALGTDGPARLESLPDVTDPRVLAAMDLLVQASSPAYYAMPSLLPVIAAELVVTSLERGPCVATPFGLSVFGIVLNAIGMLPAAHELGLLARRMLDRWPDRRLEARTRLVVHNNVCSWIVPVQRALDDLLDTVRVGRLSGDMEFAAIAAQCWATNALVAGVPLAEVSRTAAELGAFMRSYGQHPAHALHQPLEQLVRALLGQTSSPASLDGDGYDEEAALAEAKRVGSASYAFVTLSDMLVARFHFGTAEDAWGVAERAAPYQAGAASTHHLSTFHLYAPLAAARLYPRVPEATREALLAKIDASLAQLEAWAAVAPLSFAHRALLVRAERSRILGEPDAEATYRRALEAARATEFVNDEALTAELAGRFHLGRGGAELTIARAFLEDARFAYQRWGAEAKVRALDVELPHLLGRAPVHAGVDVTLGSVVGLDLDAAAVIKAARNLSATMELDALLRALFRTALEAAGAERAILLLPRDDHWELALEGDADSEPMPTARRLEECDGATVPVGILRHALRTRRTLLLDDAMERRGPHAADPYVVANHVRSVHCLPLVSRGQPSAVLYLEHRTMPGVFTPRRAALMELLASQATVSLENARLYEAQRQLARQQDRFVPHEFLESLGKKDLADVALGQHVEKTMSVLFTDLHRFTTLVESLGARAIVSVLNEYFAAMEPAIVSQRGFIDSFNGDEIMALFDGEPDRAVQAAVEMQRALGRFNAAGRGSDRPALRMGVGVNTGPLLLGIVGGRDRIKCGVVGDAVNLASRFERLTRRYGAAAIIGDATWRGLAHPERFTARPIDRVIVKGAETPVTLYEILDAETDDVREAKERTRVHWQRALEAYWSRDFETSLELCGECMALSPRDRLPMMLANRCTRFQHEPPPEGWTGVERLLEK